MLVPSDVAPVASIAAPGPLGCSEPGMLTPLIAGIMQRRGTGRQTTGEPSSPDSGDGWSRAAPRFDHFSAPRPHRPIENCPACTSLRARSSSWRPRFETPTTCGCEGVAKHLKTNSRLRNARGRRRQFSARLLTS